MSITTLTKDNFKERVLNSETPVLVDFWAQWCGPCKMTAPLLEEISKEFEDVVKIGKVNVDEQSGLPSYYGVPGLPTLIMFENGMSGKRLVGYHTKEEIVKAFGLRERRGMK